MRALRHVSVCAAVLLTASVAAGDSAWTGPKVSREVSFSLPAVQVGKLSNGITVHLVERHDVPVVSVHVVSSLSTLDAEPGVAEMAANTVISQTYASYWRRKAERFNLVGAQLSAYSSREIVGISTRALAPNLERAVADLGELAKASFPDSDELEQRRKRTLASLGRRFKESPGAIARSLLYPAGHPYNLPEDGTPESVAKVSLGDLRAFWRRAFSPSRVSIAAAGDVRLPELMKALERTFADLEPAESAKPIVPSAPPAPARVSPIVLVHRAGATQASIAVQAVGLPYHDKRYEALSLAGSVIGGELHERIRERYGTTYGVHAGLTPGRGPEPVWIGGDVENGGVASALTTVQKVLDDVRGGRLDVEFFRFQSFAALARTFETSSDAAGRLAWYAASQTPLDEVRELPARLKAITKDEVTAVAREIWAPERLRVVIVGDEAVIRPQLDAAKLGPIEVRRP